MAGMPKPDGGESAARFAREDEASSESPPSKSTRRKKNEALVDATKLLDRLAELTSEAERARVRLESQEQRAASLQAALKKQQDLRERAEVALAQAKAASAKLSSELAAEKAARERAQHDLARVEEKAATLEQQVNLTWSQLKVSEEEQHQQGTQRRWWRGDS